MSNTRYYVNDKETYANIRVPSLVEETIKAASSDMSEHDKFNLLCLLYKLDNNYCNENETFKASSVPQHGDEYDEYTGKHIAALKADKKYHNKRIVQYSRILKTILDYGQLIRKLIHKHYESKLKIEDILGDNYDFDMERFLFEEL